MNARILLLGCMTVGALLFAPAASCQSSLHPHLVAPQSIILGAGPNGLPDSSIDVALNRSGDGVVVYRRRIAPPPLADYELWAQRFMDGSPVGTPMPLGSCSDHVTGTAELGTIRCDVDEYGNWVATWYGHLPGEFALRVFARRGHVQSAALGPIMDISPMGAPEHHILPDVAMGPWSPAGVAGYYIVWQKGTANGQSTILAQPFELPAGGALTMDIPSPILTVPSEPTISNGGQERPAVDIDALGNVTFVWRRFDYWGQPVPSWRCMLRRRSGFGWNPVADPTALGAINGLDHTDYEVSPVGSLIANSNPEAVPHVDSNGRGEVFIAYRRLSYHPYGMRKFALNWQGLLAPSAPEFTWLPGTWSAGFGELDLQAGPDGLAYVLWKSTATPQGGVGWAILSRTNGTGTILDEGVVASQAGEAITSMSFAVADTGQTVTAVTRGPWVDYYRAYARLGDIDSLNRTGPPGLPTLSVSTPGYGGLPYFVWPTSTPPVPGATPLADGRSADLLLSDPLLSWHLSNPLGNPALPGSTGILDPQGAGSVFIPVPPTLPATIVHFSWAVVDPALPFPAQVLLLTHPEPIVLP